MHIGEHLEIEILTKFREGSQDCSLYANNLKTKVLLMVHGARECMFQQNHHITLARQVALYKTCKLANPIAMQDYQSLPEFTAAVRSPDRFNDADINAMSKEYSTYNL